MNKYGFTLIELCVVLLLFSLLATLSFTRVDRVLRYSSLSHLNMQLFGFVHNVQNYAVLTNQNISLCIKE